MLMRKIFIKLQGIKEVSEMKQQKSKAVEKQPKSKIKEAIEDIKDWIKRNVTSPVALSVTALLISIVSATLSIGKLIQYLISH